MAEIIIANPILAPQSLGYTSAPVWTGTTPIPSQNQIPTPIPGIVSGNEILFQPDALPAGVERRVVGFLAWYGDGADARATIPVATRFSFLPEGQDAPVDVTLSGILVAGGWVLALPFLDVPGSRRALTNLIWNSTNQPLLRLGGFTNAWSKGMGYLPAPGDGIFEAIKALRMGEISPERLCSFISEIRFAGCGTGYTNSADVSSLSHTCEPPPPPPRNGDGGPVPLRTSNLSYSRVLPLR